MTPATSVQSPHGATREQVRAPMPARIVLVSKGEIADRLGVTVKAVERWISVPDIGFPDPEWRLAIGPVWRWTTISKWSRRTGYPRPAYNRSEPHEE